VAAAVGSMKKMLRDHADCLYAPDDAASLARTLLLQLTKPTIIEANVASLPEMAVDLETFFLSVLHHEA
jgi:hypothetical protein